jgi:DNA polymerase-3 subunit gamma/tau
VLESEGVRIAEDALALIARSADGSMRDALSLADQVIAIGEGPVTAERVREALGLAPEDEFINVLDIIAEHRAGDVFTAVNRLADAGIDFGVFLSGFADMLRAQLTVLLSDRAEGVSAHALAELRGRRDKFTAGDLLRMISAINELEPNFRKSGQQQLLVEMLLLRMSLLDRTVAFEDMLKSLGGTRSESAESSPPARHSPPPQSPTQRQRPATRPGYPPQLDAPNGPPPEPSRQSLPPVNENQLREMKRAMETTAQDSNRSRMTPEALKEERIGMLRQKDPALGAAIDELDLELLD